MLIMAGGAIANIADLVDPDDSEFRTYRQINKAKPFKYSVGESVVVSTEAEITKLTRDCDGTPLYSTSYINGISEHDITPISDGEEELTTQVKFIDMPIGGRFKEYGKTWVVLEKHGRGKIIEYTGERSESIWQLRCCFTDPDEGITLDTEVPFID
jgi:hypothetical protein